MRKRGFTLIELIVVMAIISILVLLGAPKYKSYTEEARITKLTVEAKELEKASQQYYIKNQDWPRLNDDAYSKEEIVAFGKKIYDKTGKVVVLEDGNYYDIDYSKLSNYISKPTNPENYILQNPVGNVYSLYGLANSAKTRLTDIKLNDIILDKTILSLAVGSSQKITATLQPLDATHKALSWTSSDETVATVDTDGNVTGIAVGNTIITVTSWNGVIIKSCAITVESPFISQTFNLTGLPQTFEVPVTGIYQLEVRGAKGAGTNGGAGGYSSAQFNFSKGTILDVYVGGVTFNGGGVGTGNPGGGASDIRLDGYKIIVAGGGGGGNVYSGGYGGGANQNGGIGTKKNEGSAVAGGAGTLSSGGSGRNTINFGSLGNGGQGSSGGVYGPGAGGGGGYYGGGGGYASGSGGGGSGYVDLQKAISGTVAGASGSNAGNGVVKITFISN